MKEEEIERQEEEKGGEQEEREMVIGRKERRAKEESERDREATNRLTAFGKFVPHTGQFSMGREREEQEGRKGGV
jgi:hypothetical protein